MVLDERSDDDERTAVEGSFQWHLNRMNNCEIMCAGWLAARTRDFYVAGAKRPALRGGVTDAQRLLPGGEL